MNKMKRILNFKAIGLILVMVFLLNNCASTNIRFDQHDFDRSKKTGITIAVGATVVGVLAVLLFHHPYKSKISYYSNPKFQDVRFNRLLIFPTDKNLIKNQQIEIAFANTFVKREHSVELVPYDQIMKPTENYVEKDAVDLANDNRIDGVMTVEVTNEVDCDATEHEAYSVFNLRLIDVRTGNCVWTGTNRVRGGSNDFKHSANSMAKKVSEILAQLKYIK